MPKTLHQILVNLKLINAAAAGCTAAFDGLLREGADINGVEHTGTALIAATAGNQAHAVRKLIELKAQVDLADAQGNTALSQALHHRHGGIAQLLVQFGADLHGRNLWGDTRLTEAARIRDQAMVDELVALRVDVNITNSMGQSALMLADSHPGIVRSLLLAKADLADPANSNAVLGAVIGNKPDVACLLLFAGANPDAVDWTYRAVLTHAVEQRDASLVQCLLAANADPNQGANQYALAAAVAAPDPALLQALLDAGACPDVSGRAGQNAVVAALISGNADVLARWYPADSVLAGASSQGAIWDPMSFAVAVGTAQTVEVLRDAGRSIDLADQGGHDLLMLASHRGQPDVIHALLQPRPGQPGADPNASAPCDGQTALMFAAQAARIDAVRLLLAAGANPYAVDAEGRSAMDHAGRAPLDQRNAVQFVLAEAMAARALERAGLVQRPYTLEDLAELQEDMACIPRGSDPGAWTEWTQGMNDIDECSMAVDLPACGTPSLLPYHLI